MKLINMIYFNRVLNYRNVKIIYLLIYVLGCNLETNPNESNTKNESISEITPKDNSFQIINVDEENSKNNENNFEDLIKLNKNELDIVNSKKDFGEMKSEARKLFIDNEIKQFYDKLFGPLSILQNYIIPEEKRDNSFIVRMSEISRTQDRNKPFNRKPFLKVIDDQFEKGDLTKELNLKLPEIKQVEIEDKEIKKISKKLLELDLSQKYLQDMIEYDYMLFENTTHHLKKLGDKQMDDDLFDYLMNKMKIDLPQRLVSNFLKLNQAIEKTKIYLKDLNEIIEKESDLDSKKLKQEIDEKLFKRLKNPISISKYNKIINLILPKAEYYINPDL
ncbi:MAG: hypothetical protein GY830_06405 [Bacteroidetes bacterium]|nr:hypothetical protein [Bacteroidota bacterium]